MRTHKFQSKSTKGILKLTELYQKNRKPFHCIFFSSSCTGYSIWLNLCFLTAGSKPDKQEQKIKLLLQEQVQFSQKEFIQKVYVVLKQQNLQMQKQYLLKIIDPQKSILRLQRQLSIVKKIIDSIIWLNKNRVDKQVLYEISKFLFRNPLVFTTCIYKKVDNGRLKIQQKKSYILMNNQIDKNHISLNYKQAETKYQINMNNHQSKQQNSIKKNFDCDQKQTNRIKQGQYLIHIKVNRCWKNSKINYTKSSFKEIIMKSRHFIQFLKNIKIDNPKNNNLKREQNYEGQNLQEKQNKLYTLICENYDYILSRISQIQENQKLKKFDDVIAKTYVEMMNKNIIILTIEKNNSNPISYKSQGKYIYVSNHLKIPLISEKFQRIYGNLETFKVEESMLSMIPFLQINSQGEWFLKNKINGSLELFQQKGKQIDRGKGIIIDRYLNWFQYDDFSIRKI